MGTYHEDNDVRLEACKQLCPCTVQKDIDAFWERVFEMAEDEDDRIRKRSFTSFVTAVQLDWKTKSMRPHRNSTMIRTQKLEELATKLWLPMREPASGTFCEEPKFIYFDRLK